MYPIVRSMPLSSSPLRLAVVGAAHLALFYVVADALRLDFTPPREPRTVVVRLPVEPPILEEPEDKYGPLTRVPIGPLPTPPPVPEDAPAEPLPESARPPPSGAVGGFGPPVPGAVSFSPVRADPRHPLTQPDYPAAAIRLEEQGVVELAIYVLRDGRIGDIRIARSSGHPRLDRAAVEEARRRWRLRPALRDGEAIDEWGKFRVVFRIEGR